MDFDKVVIILLASLVSYIFGALPFAQTLSTSHWALKGKAEDGGGGNNTRSSRRISGTRNTPTFIQKGLKIETECNKI